MIPILMRKKLTFLQSFSDEKIKAKKRTPPTWCIDLKKYLPSPTFRASKAGTLVRVF